MHTSLSLRLGALVALPALAVGLSGCGAILDTGKDADTKAGASASSLTGSVSVDGSSTVAPLTRAAAERFEARHPGVAVSVEDNGTGAGFEAFCSGETDMSDASRPAQDEEKLTCARNDIAVEEFTVANDALTVVVHKDNDWIDCVTTGQLKKIWEPGSKIKSWREVDPSFPDEPLQLFGPGVDSGTFDYFTETVNGEEKASRADFTPSEDDNVLVQGVSASKGGLGYFGYTYYEENADTLKALKIDAGKGCVAPGVGTVQDHTYPLSRPLFIYPSAAALDRPEVLAFVEFYVDNHASIAEESKYIPLSSAQEKKLRVALAGLKRAHG
ncbi:Protein SphX [Streptomyces sp. RB5]|uniref:Phosphate-binding protein n=1 Tax=Streptomyces smaragdinus TaxID=2585196 RepID=A0A7K0CLG7_9ACTN|nr:PstS family phosphate ABC transporter substrate-binding protein [Streptomyces smaragdinus]MQY14261.1 Protein SphX [Streptomyces smaragdinus]